MPMTRKRPRHLHPGTHPIPAPVGIPLAEGAAPTHERQGAGMGSPARLASLPATVLVGSVPHAAGAASPETGILLKMRITLSIVRLLQVFLSDPDATRWGYELLKLSGVKRSTLYPALTRLEDAGWIEGKWENVDEEAEGRPARRYYRLTLEGSRCADEAVANALTPAHSLRPSLGTH
jgi:PadR family transcriptional regulator PadR